MEDMRSNELETKTLEELLTIWSSGEYKALKYYRLIRAIMKRYNEADVKRENFVIEWKMLQCSMNKHGKKRFTLYNDEDDFTSLFPKEDKERIIEIAQDEQNPFIKARYLDLVWFVHRDINVMDTLVAAYKQCIDSAIEGKLAAELYDSLDRLFSLYAETKNSNELKATYLKSIGEIENLFEQGEAYYGRKLIEAILDFSKWLNGTINYEVLLTLCEKGINSLIKKNQSYFSDEREFLKLKAICEKELDRDPQNSIMNIGYSFIGEAEWVIENRKTHMVGSIMFTKALEHFVKVGAGRTLIEDLKKRIVESNKIMYEHEMGTVSDHKTVDFAEFSDWIETLEESNSTEEVLKLMMSTYYMIPDYNESVKYVESKPKDWTSELVHIQFDNGKKRSESNDVEGKLKNDIRFDYGRMIMVYLKHSVKRYFDVLETRNDLEDELYNICSNTPLIDQNQLEIIQLAIAHYKNNEYPASIHLIMFQLEGILRNLVKEIGGTDISVKTGGVMNTRLLPDLLTELQSTDFKFYKFLTMFLTEEGINYRNKIGHSEFKISNMEISLNRYLIIIVLMIIGTEKRIIEKEKQP